MPRAWIACVALLIAAPAALAKDRDAPTAPPELYQQLLDCRTLGDSAERLACFDRQVNALAAAADKREILIADKAQLQEARRGLFGFAAPIGRLLGFGGDEDDGTKIDRIETTITNVRGAREGGWKLTFAEGGTWEQTDRMGWPLSPKVGNRAIITRGTLGSYFVAVDGMSGIKMRRVE